MSGLIQTINTIVERIWEIFEKKVCRLDPPNRLGVFELERGDRKCVNRGDGVQVVSTRNFLGSESTESSDNIAFMPWSDISN